MSRLLRTWFGVGYSLVTLVAGGVAGGVGCSSSSSAPSEAGDSGGQDASLDSATDGPEPDVSQNDTGSPPGDSSTPLDSGKDSGPSSCPGGATAVHVPPGFTQVAGSGVDQSFGYGVSMALDENDDPMFAYLAVQASVQSGMAPANCSPQTTPDGCDAVYFTRWDPCAAAFTTPIVVEPVLNYAGSNSGSQVLSLAYDRSTKEIGIAYLKVFPTDPNWADTYDTIWLATRKAGQSSFATQQVSDNLRWGTTDVSNTDSPSLAMGGGNLYLAFTASFGAPGCAFSSCLRFAASSSTPPEAGTGDDAGDDAGDAAASDAAAPPPPHYFDLSYVQYAAGGAGELNPRPDAVSIAIDGMGRPGIAAYQIPLTAYNTVLVYWRSDMAQAVAVTDTSNVQNDFVSLSLAFEGIHPRVAGMLSRDLTSTSSYSTTYVSSPDDGTTWNAAQPFVLSAGLAYYTSLATDGKGNEAFTSHYNTSIAPIAQEAGCGPDPFVSRSTNGGAAWSGCTVSTTSVDTNGSLSSAYGASRISGKFVMAGNIMGNGMTMLDGAAGNSVVFYQDP